MKNWLIVLIVVGSGMMTTRSTAAEEIAEIKLVLENSWFSLEVVNVKAKTPVILVIKTKDSAVRNSTARLFALKSSSPQVKLFE